MQELVARPRHRRTALFRRLIALAAIASLATTATASAEPGCNRATPIGSTCQITLAALHPTQSAVGMIEVEERAARIKPGTDFIRYTRKHPAPVVQAPDGAFYLTDGHHLARVLERAGAHDVIVRVIGRFTDMDTFWPQMRVRHWVYLFDTKGKSIAPSALPQRIADMVDDPYRSLASYAERAGYFHRSNSYFMEFEWARYFGSHMAWQNINRLNLLTALETAEKLACQPEARALPGYAGPCNSKR